MSISTSYLDAAAPERAETRTLLLIVWPATVLTYLIAGLSGELSTDDAMRLVEVRDFLAGQSWFDLTQYRLDPPAGVAMHWSRLIDLPLAALIRGAELVAPAGYAERFALLVWPSVLMLAFFAGVVSLSRHLAGDVAARVALLFAAVAAPVLQHFRPGAIDHHNAQLALLVWTLAFAVRSPARPRDAATVAVLSALSLAIGQEMVPAIAALAGALALRWIVTGERARPATAAFGGAFALAAYALFAVTVPAGRYWTAQCDALSIAQVVAAGIGGIGIAALALAPLASVSIRLAGAGGLSVLLAATVLIAFPGCLADPYGALDPRLAALWLSNVSEARSIFSMLHDLPQEVLPHVGLPLAALALAIIRSARDENRWPWIICTAVLAVLTGIALWEVRGAAAANALASALAPAALLSGSAARPVFFGLGRAALIAVLALNPLALIALGQAAARGIEALTGVPRPHVLSDGAGTCRAAADYTPLATLPRGVVLGFIDAGPFVLMETPHSVLAAPYHRNGHGNSAMLDVMLGSPSDAAERMTALGVDYVAFCPGAPERYNYAAAAPNGLAAALARDEVPPGLERVPLAGTPLRVYRRKS